MADDFPIVCEKCLGPNPYLRMTKVPLGATCSISSAPFTVHRWKAPGVGRQRQTIISREVATTKNVCQCCLHDLEYGLPSHLVDSLVSAVHGAEALPASDANREFFWDEKRKAVTDGREDGGAVHGKLRAQLGKLERIAAMAPYTNPYRHGPGQVPPPRQRPDAAKRDGADDKRRDLPPRDTSITTLYVTGITPSMRDGELARFFAPYGAIASIKLDYEHFCAHVRFHERASAFACACGLKDNLTVQGTRLRVMWARNRAGGLPPGIRETSRVAACDAGVASLPPGVKAPAGAEPGAPVYPSASADALDAAGARPER
ncbi:hypothetical protein KFE25_007107 [Diacronema lutheri]|uniref:RRM domain-containing protein n=2 Tax=Diacronema lutheri TaxID=2081491 RepID=A0A8J5XYX7_DIALT|nr:hypothetical protein KFE25_007107 [Diacronema lutheri]